MIPIDRNKITAFCKSNNIAFFGLFGSAARGDIRHNSDVDVLVRYARPVGLFDHSRIALELESLLGRRVDLVTDGALNKYIRANVYRDLQPVYGKLST